MNRYQFTEAELKKLKMQYKQVYEHYTESSESDNDSQAFCSVQTMLAFNVYFMEAVRRILIEKNVATKEEINDMLDRVFDEEFRK